MRKQEMDESPRIKQIEQFMRNWRKLFRVFEGTLVDNIAATSPWLAPLIPAYIGYHSMRFNLLWDPWICMVGAIIIETLGLSTVHSVFMLWDYNDTKRKTDQQAPLKFSIIVATFYMVVVLVVNVLLDPKFAVLAGLETDTTEGLPLIHVLSKALLSSLSVISATSLAIRSSHARRVEEVEDAKAEEREYREKRRNAGQTSASSGSSGHSRPVTDTIKVSEMSEVSGDLSVSDWRHLSTDEQLALNGLSTNQIMDKYGLSERTARRWRVSAQELKRTMNGNGHKVEIPEF